ncbi:hypothetical protein ABK040_008569 [Willaertia magna]
MLVKSFISRPEKTGLETTTLPNRKTPIECRLGQMKIKLNPEGTFEYLGEVGNDEFVELNQTELSKLKQHALELEEENACLKLKNEILLDLLATTSLDAKYLEQTLLKIKREGLEENSAPAPVSNHSSSSKNVSSKESKEAQHSKEVVKETNEKKIVPKKKQQISTEKKVVKTSSHGTEIVSRHQQVV